MQNIWTPKRLRNLRVWYTADGVILDKTGRVVLWLNQAAPLFRVRRAWWRVLVNLLGKRAVHYAPRDALLHS